jgi:hypothetical protein
MPGLNRHCEGVEIITLTGVIIRAGGQGIEDEALKHVPVSGGKAIATTGGKLKENTLFTRPP